MEMEGVLNDAGQQLQHRITLKPGHTLQIPQATVHSSLVTEAWLAWHSIPSIISILNATLAVLWCGPYKGP